MSHLEARLERDLNQIRQQIDDQAKLVQEAIKQSVHALQTGNSKLAYATVLNDHPINRKMREIDRLCHSFIAVHLPSAGHLRVISSTIRVNIALERIGDYAGTIARESVKLSSPPSGSTVDTLELVSGEAQQILDQASSAFHENNAEAAKAVIKQAAKLEQSLEPIYKRMLSDISAENTRDQLGVFIILNQLKRVADQAKNICEDTVFSVTGDTKAPKVYNILFLDERNSLRSQMAEAIGKMNFPNSGQYSSAGLTPADSVNQGLIDFLEGRGISPQEAEVRAVSDITYDELVTFHIIVSLGNSVSEYIDEVPFHTTVLEWDVGPSPKADDSAAIESLYRELAVKISDLMTLLRGEGAS
ncbi:MAG: PhoU domain-containing protein [Pseudomonadota bacterium]